MSNIKSPWCLFCLQPVGITSHMIPHPYPGSNRTMQLEGHCPSLQNVTALDVDYTRGRLWVLDAGTAICCPKVVVFDLRRNEEVSQAEIMSHFKWGEINSV
jgi:hypothetical protein